MSMCVSTFWMPDCVCVFVWGVSRALADAVENALDLAKGVRWVSTPFEAPQCDVLGGDGHSLLSTCKAVGLSQ